MMSDQNPTQQPPAKPQDHRAKLIFLALVLGAIFLVYMLQRSDPMLKSWNQNLDATLAQAGKENRSLVVLFDSIPPSEIGRDMVRNTFPKNTKALTEGNFLTVHVGLRGTNDPVARKYRIQDVPTTLLLYPDGAEKNRRVGKIGELPFRNGFLDCTEVVSPPSDSSRP